MSGAGGKDRLRLSQPEARARRPVGLARVAISPRSARPTCLPTRPARPTWLRGRSACLPGLPARPGCTHDPAARSTRLAVGLPARSSRVPARRGYPAEPASLRPAGPQRHSQITRPSPPAKPDPTHSVLLSGPVEPASLRPAGPQRHTQLTQPNPPAKPDPIHSLQPPTLIGQVLAAVRASGTSDEFTDRLTHDEIRRRVEGFRGRGRTEARRRAAEVRGRERIGQARDRSRCRPCRLPR